MAERRAAHDPPRRAVGDLVGEVGLAAGDQRPGQVAVDLAGPLAVVPAAEGVEVEARARSDPQVAHRPPVSCVDLGLQPPHPGQPGVGVRGAGGVVAADLGVGEDQEPVLGQRGHPRVGDLVGGERGVAGEQVLERPGLLEHPGLHALRADGLDGDAAVAVGDREPLGEADRGVLGHGVRRRADHREQPGGRRGDHEPAALAVLEPARARAAGRPGRGPSRWCRSSAPSPRRRPGRLSGWVRSMPAFAMKTSIRPSASVAVSTSARTPASEEQSPGAAVRAELLGHRAAGGLVEVVDHDPRSLGDQPAGERPADPVPGAGHDGPGVRARFCMGHTLAVSTAVDRRRRLSTTG